MAQRGNPGFGWLIIGVIALAAMGQCSSDTTNTGGTAAVAEASSSALAVKMYVEAASLNCRAESNATADVSERLRRGDRVNVTETSGTWSKVETLSMAKCWVSTQFLSEYAPKLAKPKAARVSEPAASAPSYFASPRPERRHSASSGSRSSRGSCGSKRVCGQMNSCAEAMHYLNQCGLYRLDRDGDGVPCESIC